VRQGHLWELVSRLARTAAWEQLSPHCLRHSAPRCAGHKDPRTTRRYDHSRDSLERNTAYTVAAYLA
jgi:integrase/recombinase XerD